MADKKLITSYLTNTQRRPEVKKEFTHKSIDFYNFLKVTKFTPVPHNINDREKRIALIKNKYNLSYIDKLDKKAVIHRQVVGENEVLEFNKLNPVQSVGSKLRPNNYQWSIENFNNGVVETMANLHEINEESKFIFIIIIR